jgi:hypothetical protein
MLKKTMSRDAFLPLLITYTFAADQSLHEAFACLEGIDPPSELFVNLGFR